MAATGDSVRQQVLLGMAAAIAAGDWDAGHEQLQFVRALEPAALRADILNHLLLMPGHWFHQQVMRDIQALRSPSSVAYIRQVLQGGFRLFDYTASEAGVIAKWFSHALADIGTPEAVSVIREFARSDDPAVAAEMEYRLERLAK